MADNCVSDSPHKYNVMTAPSDTKQDFAWIYCINCGKVIGINVSKLRSKTLS